MSGGECIAPMLLPGAQETQPAISQAYEVFGCSVVIHVRDYGRAGACRGMLPFRGTVANALRHELARASSERLAE